MASYLVMVVEEWNVVNAVDSVQRNDLHRFHFVDDQFQPRWDFGCSIPIPSPRPRVLHGEYQVRQVCPQFAAFLPSGFSKTFSEVFTATLFPYRVREPFPSLQAH